MAATQKICSKCMQVKSITDFTRRLNRPCGVRASCRACNAKEMRLRRRSNPELFRRRRREFYWRHREQEIKDTKRWQKENPEKVLAQQRRYYDENRDKLLAKAKLRYASYREHRKISDKRWKTKNKYKIQAHSKLRTALLANRVNKKSCEVCGEVKVHAHHDDYSKPLNVKWLCSKHHGELHKLQRRKTPRS